MFRIIAWLTGLIGFISSVIGIWAFGSGASDWKQTRRLFVEPDVHPSPLPTKDEPADLRAELDAVRSEQSASPPDARAPQPPTVGMRPDPPSLALQGMDLASIIGFFSKAVPPGREEPDLLVYLFHPSSGRFVADPEDGGPLSLTDGASASGVFRIIGYNEEALYLVSSDNSSLYCNLSADAVHKGNNLKKISFETASTTNPTLVRISMDVGKEDSPAYLYVKDGRAVGCRSSGQGADSRFVLVRYRRGG